MSESSLKEWSDKMKLFGRLRSHSRSNNIVVYFKDKTCQVVFVKPRRFKDEHYLVSFTPLDYTTVRRYVRNGAFIIFEGRPTTPLVRYLLKGRGRRWLRVKHYNI